ncbi:MAG: poly-gamma-glutamate hydrolase family protein [Filomicrobium sp.]
MADKYRNFDALCKAERNGVDYHICLIRRISSVAVIAPHGGFIEPGTSEIAAAVAGDDYNLYCFEGLRDRPHGDLHITSHRFDEPQCVGLLRDCQKVIAVHGRAGTDRRIEVGGLDAELRDAIHANLVSAEFESEIVDAGELAGRHSLNICNRSVRKMGCQVEVSKALRALLTSDGSLLNRFSQAIRLAL